ncbi:DNA repair and recombination protein RAD54B-like [Eurosta solidaginis]|uniref:DNA repair and recombination protein RAD54B-like n=1 Tax=Eurosta solidaginis TaxID=178769 RepID=UPI003530BC9B
MRRSCAPSMLKAREVEKRRKIDKLFENTEQREDEVSSTTWGNDNWGTSRKEGVQQGISTKDNNQNSEFFNSKVIFNVVWREITKKKHKTWDGDGLLEVHIDPPRALLKDSSGKYMGCNSKFKIDELEEGYQMVVGGKEIELLEQITHRNEYFAMRKRQLEHRWGTDEEYTSGRTTENLKVSTLYQAPYKIKNGEELSDGASSSKTSAIEKHNIVEARSSVMACRCIYNVVWREMSTKKNKIWNGDGTFEVSNNRGVLRDENGREMGELENVNTTDMKVGVLIALADKEFEILDSSVDGETETSMKIKQNVKKIKIESSPATKELFLLPAPPPEHIAALDADSPPIKPVAVSHKLALHLRPHQRDGVAFLYKCIMGFVNPQYTGCILADEMGLGKTLQCIALAHTLLKGGPYGGERILQRVLIVTPSTLARNWENEINKWLKTERMYAYVVGAKHKLSAYTKQQHMPFVIVSYESLLAHTADFQRLKFDMLICDEGHRLKNQTTKIVNALRELNIRRRIIITGTPVQNDLREFYALANFVNPGIFGTTQEFHLCYELPLQQAQCPDADEEVKSFAAQSMDELAGISDCFVLRRLQNVNGQYLTRKYEYICFVQPSELQQFMMQTALHLYAERKETIFKDLTALQIITVLKKICNHPSLIARTKTPNLLTRHLERALPDCSEMGPFDSAKLKLVQHFLVTLTTLNSREKCVLVSNHTKTLNMLQGLCDFLNIKCVRLEGSTSLNERNANVDKFNNAEDETLIFLLSAKAGGVGLNLIGASRLILFDQDWNPATDAQALSRIWREGQQKDVHIYRLVTAGCIEEKIFQRQIAKISLGDCVIKNMGRADSKDDTMKFSVEELLDLFRLQDDYSVCQTHESLNCGCDGDGENLLPSNIASSAREINELMNWRHYKPPFNTALLELACMDKATDNLIYIFANQTDFN